MKIINPDKTKTSPVAQEPEEPSLFVKKTELAEILAEYAKESHNHSTFDVAGIVDLLNEKAKKVHSHNSDEISGLPNLLSKKADVEHTHSASKVTGLQSLLETKASVEHTHLLEDITDLNIFSPWEKGLVPKAGNDPSLFLAANGAWKKGLTLNDVSSNIESMLPVTALRWPNYLELSGSITDVLPAQAKRWPSFDEVTGNINNVLPSTAKRWPTFSEIGGNIQDVLPANFNDPIEFGDIVGDVDDILPETAKRWPTYDEIEGEIESQLTDHALRWPSYLEVTGDIRTVLPEQGKRWPYYTEIMGDIEDYLPETALRWPHFDEILGSFLGLLPETAIRWPTLAELGITNVDGAAVFDPSQFEVENPVTPFNFTANAGIDFVLLSWNLPNYNGHAYTEIYRFTDDVENPVATGDINDASKIGETTGFIYTDQVDVGSAHYYWIRFVNTDGEYSDFTPVNGLYAQTSLNYDALIGKARNDVLNSLEIWKNSIREATDILDNQYFETILNMGGTIDTLSDQVLISEARITENVLLSENRLGTKYDEYVEFTETELEKTGTRVSDLTASVFETDENGNVILDGTGAGALAGAFVTSVDNVTASKFEAEAESRKQVAAAVFQVNEDGSYVVDEDGVPVISGAFSDTIEKVTASEIEAIAEKTETVSASIFVYEEDGSLRVDENGNPVLTGAFTSTVEEVTASRFESAAERQDELVAIMFRTNNDGTVATDDDGNPLVTGAFSTTIDNVTATSREAIASKQTQLAATLFSVDTDGNPLLNADGEPVLAGGFSNSVEEVTATAITATASRITNLSAAIFSTDTQGNILFDEDGNPLITGSFSNSVEAVASDERSSTAAKIDELSSTIFERDSDGNLILDEDGKPSLISAFIDSVDATLAAYDGEVMAAIGETVGVERDGVTYTLSDILSAALDADGNYTAQWGIKTTIDDLQYGVGFVARTDGNGNVRTGFHVAADTFSVHNPANGEEVFPLIIDEDGNVLISTAIIDTAVITDLVAEKIVVDELFAGKQIVSPIIKGGEISINDKFVVDEEGNAVAKSLSAYGLKIYADDNSPILNSDGLNGTYIKDLTVDTLKIKDNAVTIKSYSETSSVNVAAGGENFLYSSDHTHDGQESNGSLLVTIIMQSALTTTGQGGGNLSFTADILDASDDSVIQSQIVIGVDSTYVGIPEFTNMLIFAGSVDADEIYVRVKAESTRGGHTVAMRVVVDSAKR